MTSKDEQGRAHRLGPRKYACIDCDRTFALKASLIRHRTFECDKQPVAVERDRNEKTLRKKKKKYLCPDCDRVYAVFTSLWRHRNYECGVEPKFVCPICRFRFTQKNIASVFKHTCTTCGKTYKHKHHLKRHHDFECGIDPKFKCAFCPHRTRYKDSLMKHILARHQYLLEHNSQYGPQQVLDVHGEMDGNARVQGTMFASYHDFPQNI
nr:PREDICTED: zinc finger protein 578-like [Megachile rotundata]